MWTTGRRAGLLAAAAAGLSLFAAHGLAGDGFFAEQFADPRTAAMLLETAFVYLLFFCVDRIYGRGQRKIARVLLLLGFAFRHLALCSVLIAEGIVVDREIQAAELHKYGCDCERPDSALSDAPPHIRRRAGKRSASKPPGGKRPPCGEQRKQRKYASQRAPGEKTADMKA